MRYTVGFGISTCDARSARLRPTVSRRRTSRISTVLWSTRTPANDGAGFTVSYSKTEAFGMQRLLDPGNFWRYIIPLTIMNASFHTVKRPDLPSSRETAVMDPSSLRKHFLIGGLFALGQIRMTETGLERMIIG